MLFVFRIKSILSMLPDTFKIFGFFMVSLICENSELNILTEQMIDLNIWKRFRYPLHSPRFNNLSANTLGREAIDEITNSNVFSLEWSVYSIDSLNYISKNNNLKTKCNCYCFPSVGYDRVQFKKKRQRNR